MTAITNSPAQIDESPAPRPSPAKRVARWRRKYGVQAGYLLPALIFLSVFTVALLVELARMSVSDVTIANLLTRDWPFVGVENFVSSFEDGSAQRAAVNTAILVVVAVAVTLVMGFLAAVSLQSNTWFNKLTQALVFFLWALPPIVTGSVWKFVLSSDGAIPAVLSSAGWAEPPAFLADYKLSIWSVSLVVSWVSVAFASLVLRAGLNGVDPNLLEAARVDGANRWQCFRVVVLPALRPVMLVQGMLTVLYSFRVFDFPFVMTSGGPGDSSTTLPFLAYRQSFGALQFGTGAATAMASVAVVLVIAGVFLYLSRNEDAQ